MRPCENVNFCLFCECAYLENGEGWECSRDKCILNKEIYIRSKNARPQNIPYR